MVLRKTDQNFIGEHGAQIMKDMKEYRKLTGNVWHCFNYTLGYSNAEEWYNALLEELKKLKNNTTKG